MAMFKDQVAIITGGASGIGEAVCQELGLRGSVVVVADINEDCARQVASAITDHGGRAHAVCIDVSEEEQVKRLVDETVAKHGHLDYMFNNAGISIGGDARDLKLEQWRRVIGVDLLGVIYGAHMAYAVMAKQGAGHIVNTASAAGLFPFPTNAPYATTKHAVVGFSLSLRLEAADLGVKVSVVCPGVVRTNIYQTATIVNAPRDQATAQFNKTFGQFPFKTVDPPQAASTILRGVERNEAVIVFPGAFLWLWRLYRLHPELLQRSGLKMVRDLRKIRSAV